ncbi:MAG: hypothetical protein AM1032_000362 [Mycoplasmataceae bacterium]|nr:MAG: hypothetical protein AM1032_000362 [Mycoplasmataceae bacterium]
MKNAQEWLEQDYPLNDVYQGGFINNYNRWKRRNEVEKIYVNPVNGLEGSLKLEGFDSLKEFNCENSWITELELTNAYNLRKINCSNNNLSKLNLKNLNNLEELDCSNNNLNKLDISGCHNLKSLKINGNIININQVIGIEILWKNINAKKTNKNYYSQEQEIEYCDRFEW